jgi:8-oxo-dGTP pyrophosphatase MutT (NUDIX family)
MDQYNVCMTKSPLYEYLSARLQGYQARQISQPDLAEAGVLVAITDEAQPRILLTLRSSNLSSHQGEVAFPGGKRDPEDESIIATALREAEEEVALTAAQVQVVGQLSQVVSRFGYLVTPVLAIIPPDVTFVANPDELDAVFSVPLDYFRRKPSGYFERGTIRVPSYDYEGFHIWGLTSMMITEMMNDLWDCDISYSI